MLKESLLRTLSLQRTTNVLLLANALVAVAMIWLTRNTVLADAWSYIALAEGILHGEYGMWWPLEQDYPDTVRTPGLPLLIAGAMGLFGTWKAMILVNIALYALAFWFTLKVIRRIDGSVCTTNIFLLVSLPMVYVPFYITQVYTEIPALAAISAVLLISTRPGTVRWYENVALGLLFGFLFQLKPVFLLFPLFHAFGRWWFARTKAEMAAQFAVLFIFGLTLLPYAVWNERNHGVFKVTPLEGGAGVMHFGYWCGKLPGYTEKVYWHNFAGDELVRFVPDSTVPGHIARYEEEWREINAQLEPLLTAKDSALVTARSAMPYPALRTYNARYTLLRDELLMAKAKEHLLSDWSYVVPYKLYSAVRFWVIGIQRGEFRSAGLGGKVQMLFGTVSTLLVFVAFLVIVPLAYARKRIQLRRTWQLMLFLVYVGVMHLPFAIQARYTVPVRLTMFALLAAALAGLFRKGQAACTSSAQQA